MGLDAVELVMSTENLFKIEIPDEAASRMVTVGDLHDFVFAELTRLGRPNLDRDITYDVLRTIICRQLGVEAKRVVPDARFVQDLGMG